MTICEREIIYNSKAPDIDEEETKKKNVCSSTDGPASAQIYETKT